MFCTYFNECNETTRLLKVDAGEEPSSFNAKSCAPTMFILSRNCKLSIWVVCVCETNNNYTPCLSEKALTIYLTRPMLAQCLAMLVFCFRYVQTAHEGNFQA